MSLTPEQIKGRIKNVAKQNNADARILLRIYMMERFLERVANSKYADDFIIKGGILVTSLVGVSMRSTMDIDTSIRNWNLTEEDARKVIGEVIAVDMGDDVDFIIKDISNIMDEMEYPGIRIALDASIGQMSAPLKIDISTGDVITPKAISYEYKLMLEDRSINLWSYNLETILAEKLQTVLARGVLNTRMRDYYDIYTLTRIYKNSIDILVLRDAFAATCKKRDSLGLMHEGENITTIVADDNTLSERWKVYKAKYSYAVDISYDKVIKSIVELYKLAV